MHCVTLLAFVAASAAFVLPDDHVMSQIVIESNRRQAHVQPDRHMLENFAGHTKDAISHIAQASKNTLDHAVEHADSMTDWAANTASKAYEHTKASVDARVAGIDDRLEFVREMGKHGGHGPHHKPNQTIFQLIASSKYTTKLAALVSEYDDLVQLLNGTAANYTVFAPIDKAFEKIPDKAPKPTKKELKEILLYHASKDFYPAGRVLVTTTIPTLHVGEHLGGEAQRLSTNIGLRGLTVNFYSRIVAVDIFGTNGVIHGVDSLLLPPPKAAEVIPFFPGEFSTLELGLTKTGLIEQLNDTSTHTGGTIFAPSNFAFQKLGPKLNGFLFSKYGLKYLKAILQYHIVADHTLYSDAYYEAKDTSAKSIPKGYYHVNLPTALEDKFLSVDVARWGRLISIKINAFSTVTVSDGIVSDGVIQVVSDVLLPPKQLNGIEEHYTGQELSVEDLKARLGPYIQNANEPLEL